MDFVVRLLQALGGLGSGTQAPRALPTVGQDRPKEATKLMLF